MESTDARSRQFLPKRRCSLVPRYTPYDPAPFKAGDIVDMSFSFVGIPIENGKRLLFLNLRALALVNSEIRKLSAE